MPKAPQVILYSVSRHTWEVWCQGRPLAEASSPEPLQDAYPRAMGPSQHQLVLAADAKKDPDLPSREDSSPVQERSE